MLDLLKKLNALLDTRDRARVSFLVLLMIATAVMQTAGVASLMPFLAVLSDPEMVHQNAWLSAAFEQLGFTSRETFLYFLGIVAFILFVTGTALQALTFWAITRFSYTQQYELSRRLMADYLRRPYTFFLNRNSGDLSKTVLEETNRAIMGALMPAMRLLSQLLLAGFLIALLIIVQPWLALTVATTIGSIYAVIYFTAREWLKRIGQDLVEANRQRFTAAAESFAGAKEIRLLGREGDYLERYREPSQRFARHQANSSVLQELPQYAIEAVAFGGVLILVLFLMAGPGGLAEVLPLIGLYALAGRQLIPAFQKIFSTIGALRFNIPTVDHILSDLGDRAGSTSFLSRHDVPTPLVPNHNIRVVNVTFRYPGSELTALQGISLRIPAKTTVGFVGPSGSGKSTLVDLLLGLLQPEHGDIWIDEVCLKPKPRDGGRQVSAMSRSTYSSRTRA
jgi:ATP-binding cassette, subfamily B, bacterial PglK